MADNSKPNRFTFRAPDLPDDRERLGDAEAAFNAEVAPEQSAARDAANDHEQPSPRFEAQAMPEPTPSGTRVMRRFRFDDEEREREQAEEIDLSTGEWVIEFEPERR